MFLDLKVENVVESASVWSDADVASYKAKKDRIVIKLEEYLLNGSNLLDAAKIQQNIFPEQRLMFLFPTRIATKIKPFGLH